MLASKKIRELRQNTSEVSIPAINIQASRQKLLNSNNNLSVDNTHNNNAQHISHSHSAQTCNKRAEEKKERAGALNITENSHNNRKDEKIYQNLSKKQLLAKEKMKEEKRNSPPDLGDGREKYSYVCCLVSNLLAALFFTGIYLNNKCQCINGNVTWKTCLSNPQDTVCVSCDRNFYLFNGTDATGPDPDPPTTSENMKINSFIGRVSQSSTSKDRWITRCIPEYCYSPSNCTVKKTIQSKFEYNEQEGRDEAVSSAVVINMPNYEVTYFMFNQRDSIKYDSNDEKNNKSYSWSKTWTTASNYCKSMQLELAQFRTFQELRAFQDEYTNIVINKQTFNENYNNTHTLNWWIGARQSQSTSKWLWDINSKYEKAGKVALNQSFIEIDQAEKWNCLSVNTQTVTESLVQKFPKIAHDGNGKLKKFGVYWVFRAVPCGEELDVICEARQYKISNLVEMNDNLNATELLDSILRSTQSATLPSAIQSTTEKNAGSGTAASRSTQSEIKINFCQPRNNTSKTKIDITYYLYSNSLSPNNKLIKYNYTNNGTINPSKNFIPTLFEYQNTFKSWPEATKYCQSQSPPMELANFKTMQNLKTFQTAYRKVQGNYRSQKDLNWWIGARKTRDHYYERQRGDKDEDLNFWYWDKNHKPNGSKVKIEKNILKEMHYFEKSPVVHWKRGKVGFCMSYSPLVSWKAFPCKKKANFICERRVEEIVAAC